MTFRKETLVLEVLANNLGTWMNAHDVAHELGNRISQGEVETILALLVRTGYAASQLGQRKLVYRRRPKYEGEGVNVSCLEFQITNGGYQKFRGSQASPGSSMGLQVPSFSI